MFHIAAFARLAGVSARTLRAYDARGLFRPVWVDPATGYRFYSPAQLPELRRILALRDLGMSLARIGQLVSGRVDLDLVLGERQAGLRAERAEIERRLAALGIELDRAGGSGSATPVDIVVRRVAEELVATLPLSDGAGGEETAFDELEAYVRDRDRRAPRPPGTLIDRAQGDRVFVPLSGPIGTTDRIGCQRLLAARMATVIHRGGYAGLGAARRALERWVEATGTAVTGPLRILYLQFGADPRLALPRRFLVDAAADYVTELQLPIRA
ncbi:MAG: MerR family transcriptional regulator [Candidatus Limnocylindrales bacterium]